MVAGAAGFTVPSLYARLEGLAPGQPFEFLVFGQVSHKVRIIFAALSWRVAIPFGRLWSAVLQNTVWPLSFDFQGVRRAVVGFYDFFCSQGGPQQELDQQ